MKGFDHGSRHEGQYFDVGLGGGPEASYKGAPMQLKTIELKGIPHLSQIGQTASVLPCYAMLCYAILCYTTLHYATLD